MLVRVEEDRRWAEQVIAAATQELPPSLRVLRAYTQALARELEAPAPDLVLTRQLVEQIEGLLVQVETRMNDLFGPRRN